MVRIVSSYQCCFSEVKLSSTLLLLEYGNIEVIDNQNYNCCRFYCTFKDLS